MASDDHSSIMLQARDSTPGIATLLGRLVVQFVPVALVAIFVESALALWLYPALRDVLQENWLSLGLRLWTVSIAFVLALAVVTAGVAYGLQRVRARWATFLAGVIVAIGLVGAAAPVVLRVIFPSRIPWDRSLLAVAIAFAVVTPVAGALFGGWVRVATARRGGAILGSVAGLAVLLAVPGSLYDLNVEPAELLPVSSRAAREQALLRGTSVVLVTVDTLRASHVSLYGYERETTPGIDAWAREHTVFARAITPRTFTAPSIASLLTGVYPELHGVGRHPDRLPDAMVTLAELFTDHGYRTAAYVTNPALHRSTFNFGQGFAEWHPYPEEQSTAEVVLRDAEEFLAQPDESPFFVWIHLLDPHSPYRPPPPYNTRFVDDEFYGRFRDVEMRPASGGWGPREVSLRDALGADWADLGLGDDRIQSADYLVAVRRRDRLS